MKADANQTSARHEIMIESPVTAFRVGEFLVEPALDTISKEGVTTKLQPRTMQLLVCLMGHAGQVLSVEQLLDFVWKDVVVSQDSVYQAVTSLRRLLGDDPKEPKYIENVMRRGYRLIAAVSPWIDSAPPLKAVSRSAGANRRILMIGLTSLALIGSSFIMWRQWHRMENTAAGQLPRSQIVASSGPLAIAVLPFDQSTTEDDDWEFAQALAETVRQHLGVSQKIIVKARGSSLVFADQPTDVKTIGRRLGARYLLQGSVQRKKDRLHVMAQLVDTETGGELLSYSVDRQIANIFELQYEIAGQISNAVAKQLMGPELLRAPRTRSANLDAYLKFLDAQALLRRVTVDDADQAAVILEQVTKMDPGFALAYSELARARWLAQALNLPKVDNAALLPLIEKALSLDPMLGEAYFMRAICENNDHIKEEADFRKASELAPNFAPGYELYAIASNDDFGRPQESGAMMDRAISIDPTAAEYIVQKVAYVFADTHSQALVDKMYAQALALDPNFSRVNQSLAMVKWRAGETAEAIKLQERALRVETKGNFIRVAACAMYLDIGDRQAAQSVAAGLPADSAANTMLAAYDRNFQRAAAHVPDMGGEAAQLAYWISLDAAARQSGTIAKTLLQLREKFPLSKVTNGTAPNGEYDAALTIMGDLLRARGDQASLNQVLPPLKALLDKSERRSGWAHSYLKLLSGDPDGALALLAIDMRHQHSTSWWILERDPLWADQRNDARFRDIVEFARQQAAQQREILERMRQQGEVPRRAFSSYANAVSGRAQNKGS
jgi:transcriptional activator of cad operon